MILIPSEAVNQSQHLQTSLSHLKENWQMYSLKNTEREFAFEALIVKKFHFLFFSKDVQHHYNRDRCMVENMTLP